MVKTWITAYVVSSKVPELIRLVNWKMIEPGRILTISGTKVTEGKWRIHICKKPSATHSDGQPLYEQVTEQEIRSFVDI